MSNNEVEFKVILLRELIASFFVLVGLVLGISEYIIIPLTKGNTAMQTQLIIFIMTVIGVSINWYFRKRSEKIALKKVNDKIHVVINNENKIAEEESLRLTHFFSKKYNVYTIRFNNSLYIINNDFTFSKNKNEALQNHKNKVAKLKTIITNKGQRRGIDYIPITLNISIYLLIVIALLIAGFLCFALLSGNEHWLYYFRN